MSKLTVFLLGASLVASGAAAAPCPVFDPEITAALEAYWNLEPTDEMLRGPLARLAREAVPRECLVWPALVDRVSRELFAFDPSLHASARAEAEALHRALLSGAISPTTERTGREIFKGASAAGDEAGQVSAIQETREAFVIFVTLSRSGGETVVSRYLVPKRSFEDWRDALPRVRPGRTLRPVVVDLGGTLEAPAAALACRPSAADESADLFVLTYGAPVPVNAGELLTYTIVLRNEGPDTATDSEVLLLLSDATTFQSIVPPPGEDWHCLHPPVGGKGKVSCTNKCFAPHAPAFFTITVAVEACPAGAPIQTSTVATSATPDPFPPNNFAPTNTPVVDSGVCDDHNVCTQDDRCALVPTFTENFDGVAAPFLPHGWTSTLVEGPLGAKPWQVAISAWDTRPNAAFAPDAGEIRDMVLDSPEIPIRTPTAQLTFMTYYSLEYVQDGGVLEIRIGAGPFMDILEAGGSFLEGGYNGTIINGFSSPIAGRQAWTGTVPPFTRVTVNLPAIAAGRTITLRWRLATDRFLGLIGQWVDSISVSDGQVCLPGPLSSCQDGDACTADSCDALTGCVNAPISCDDGIPCTTDACNPFTGCTHVALACDDGNPCTDDTCSGADCLHVNNAAPCSDGSACTLADVCSGGVCSGGTAVVCHDADVCTADACDPTLRCVATTANFDVTGFSTGRVDGRDLAVLADAWNSCPGNLRYTAAANLDRGGICIDLEDFHLFMGTFGSACP